MTEVMINLRRSPRKLLERDGHPGPGPGRLAMILARAGVGKTAFLVDVGIDALLAGQKVLHISLDSTVEKVRTWHVHTYADHQFTTERFRAGVELLRDVMHFEPKVVVIDGIDGDAIETDTLTGVKAVAEEIGAELWMACQTHRDGPAEPGHLPPPADRVEELVDLAFRLDSHDSKVRLHVLKDRDRMLDEDLHVFLDPQTQLVTVGFGG